MIDAEDGDPECIKLMSDVHLKEAEIARLRLALDMRKRRVLGDGQSHR